jgi:hypothetical protein
MLLITSERGKKKNTDELKPITASYFENAYVQATPPPKYNEHVKKINPFPLPLLSKKNLK